MKNITVLAVAMLISLLAAEIIARSFKTYNDTNPIELKYSENLPYLMVPNAKAKTINGIKIEINSLGLRSKEIKKEKRENFSRIVVVGDSTTYGYGVELERSYPLVLERKLREINTKNKYEVINMGHSGFNLFDYFKLTSIMGLSLDPDILIIGIMGNDFSNNNLKLSIKNGVGLRAGSFWDRYNVPPTIIKLLRNSALYLTLGNAIKGVNFSRNQAGNRSMPADPKLLDELEEVLLKFASMSSSNMFKTVFVYLPTKPEIDNRSAAYPEFIELIQKISKDNKDVYVLNILDSLGNDNEIKSKLFTDQDYVHPNLEGHEVYAKKIFEKLLSESLIGIN